MSGKRYSRITHPEMWEFIHRKTRYRTNLSYPASVSQLFSTVNTKLPFPPIIAYSQWRYLWTNTRIKPYTFVWIFRCGVACTRAYKIAWFLLRAFFPIRNCVTKLIKYKICIYIYVFQLEILLVKYIYSIFYYLKYWQLFGNYKLY